MAEGHLYAQILHAGNTDHIQSACESRAHLKKRKRNLRPDSIMRFTSSIWCVWGRQCLHSQLRALADTRQLLRSMDVHVCGSTDFDGMATAEDGLAGDWRKDLAYGESVPRAR